MVRPKASQYACRLSSNPTQQAFAQRLLSMSVGYLQVQPTDLWCLSQSCPVLPSNVVLHGQHSVATTADDHSVITILRKFPMTLQNFTARLPRPHSPVPTVAFQNPPFCIVHDVTETRITIRLRDCCGHKHVRSISIIAIQSEQP